jgi:hypothetical protein
MKKNHGIKKTPFLNNNINVTLARESSQVRNLATMIFDNFYYYKYDINGFLSINFL